MIEFSFAVDTLCALASAACAWLLFRGYRRSRARLLLWSALCFTGFTLNNILLLVDVGVPDYDLSFVRTLPALVGIALLIYGLVWDSGR